MAFKGAVSQSKHIENFAGRQSASVALMLFLPCFVSTLLDPTSLWFEDSFELGVCELNIA